MRKKVLPVFPLLFLLALLAFSGCKKDDNPVDNNNNNRIQVKVSVTGTVVDENGQPVQGASVTAESNSTTTSSTGTFIFENISVSKDRFIVTVKKSGSFPQSKAEISSENKKITMRFMLLGSQITHNISATTGGTAELGNGSKVKINSNSIVKSDGSSYTGNVNMALRYLDPTSSNFADLVPGGDMAAVRTDNSQTTLYSYGIIKVKLSGEADEDLSMGSGKESEVTVDIPPTMVSGAPSTIPLWYYDETKGYWVEEGTATKQGDKYIGTVKHFSDWNCDVPNNTATVKGKVIDCKGNPVAGITVRTGQSSTVTGADGTFERRVPTGISFTVQVTGEGNYGLQSQAVTVPALSDGQVYDVGNLNIPCPGYVKGKILNNGAAVFAIIYINWTGGYSQSYTDTDGSFKLITDVGKSAKITVYDFSGGFAEQQIDLPSTSGETKDIGEISLTATAKPGENYLILNNDGFNNQRFDITNTELNSILGYYEPSDNKTILWVTDQAQDSLFEIIQFDGNSKGNAVNPYMGFYWHDRAYYLITDDGDNLSINVTKYDGVGGLIEGTFSGRLSRLNPADYSWIKVNVSGKFSVPRFIDGTKKLPPKGKTLLEKIKSK